MKNRIVKTRNNSVDLPSRTEEDSQDVVSPSQSESTETGNHSFHAATLSGYNSSSLSVSNSISKTVLNNNDANWSKSGIDVTKDCNINGKELSPKLSTREEVQCSWKVYNDFDAGRFVLRYIVRSFLRHGQHRNQRYERLV